MVQIYRGEIVDVAMDSMVVQIVGSRRSGRLAHRTADQVRHRRDGAHRAGRAGPRQLPSAVLVARLRSGGPSPTAIIPMTNACGRVECRQNGLG